MGAFESMGTDYSMRLTRQGADGRRFGWTICRDEKPLAQSTRSFDTLTEALMDSARGAALFAFGQSEAPLVHRAEPEGENQPTIQPG